MKIPEIELKKRIVAWTWAATTLGVDTSKDRIKGLVEVTSSVHVDRLKPALELVIKSEPQGFLPSPGAVISAAKSLVDREHSGQTRSLSSGQEMSPEEHRRWMRENNVMGWDSATWAAFIERNATDESYSRQVELTRKKRHEWAAEETNREIGRRQVTAGFRIDTRRQINREGYDRFPIPHPTEDGWVPAKNFDPIAGLTKRMTA